MSHYAHATCVFSDFIIRFVGLTGRNSRFCTVDIYSIVFHEIWWPLQA